MENSKKDDLEACMKSLFSALEDEENNKTLEVIGDFINRIKKSKLNLKDPDNFNLFITYKIKTYVEKIAQNIIDKPYIERNLHKISFVYVNFDYLSNNIEGLCKLKEGSCCCYDKTRNIIEMYLKYLITDTIPEFNAKKEVHFFPHFGTYKEWMDYCMGLYSLYYGNPKNYFIAYDKLFHSEIRKYKHILHTWYLKMKDGSVIEFDHSWDEKKEHCLDNECFNKKDYYLIFGSNLDNKSKYKPDDSGDKHLRGYYQIPKKDVDSIYCKSEENYQ